MIYLKRAKRGCIEPRCYMAFLCIVGFFLFFVSAPVHSGTIELPQTGQTLCYKTNETTEACLGTGQDGDWLAGVDWPNPRFTIDSSLQCIKDNLTGLTWARDFSAQGGIWLNVVPNLPTRFFACGLDGWRVPNVNEMQSLLNADKINNALWLASQGFFFPVSINLLFWTSTSSAISPFDNAWVVDMVDGSVLPDNKGFTYFIWPVRGTSNPSPPADIPPGQIAVTGQIAKYATVYDDAYFATTPGQNVGVPWPQPRFTASGSRVQSS